MECTNSPDFAQFNTILYGHRMNNDSMFLFRRFHARDLLGFAVVCRPAGPFQPPPAQQAQTAGQGSHQKNRQNPFLLWPRILCFPM